MFSQVSASRAVSSVACTRTSLPSPKVRSARERFVRSVTSRAFITTAPTAGSFRRLLLTASKTAKVPSARRTRNSEGP